MYIFKHNNIPLNPHTTEDKYKLLNNNKINHLPYGDIPGAFSGVAPACYDTCAVLIT